MGQPEEEGKRREEEDLDHREGSPITLANKSSTEEGVILAEKDLTKEVEVEYEAEKLSLDDTNATSWGISQLSV